MKRHSTGRLSAARREEQDRRYRRHAPFDTVIIGTGMSALSVGALLARRGERVLMLEAHDRPGGMAHTFQMGDYRFCAQVHYIWGCQPRGTIYELLHKLGLEKEVTFELLDPDGFDRVILPGGRAVRVPYGFDRYAAHVGREFPGQLEPARRFLSEISRIHQEIEDLPDAPLTYWRALTNCWRYRTLLANRNSTVKQVLDRCGVSPEAQAVFTANAGDLMAPPSELSIFPYAQLVCGYNTGAYYPTQHFQHLILRLVRYIEDHGGCVFYESPVTSIDVQRGQVRAVKTADGRIFGAKRFICNADPQAMAQVIGLEHFPRRDRRALDYTYSPSGMMIYLGLRGVDLRAHGFGNFNTWHLEQWDMDRAWREQTAGDFSKPWIFMSTPTLHTGAHGLAPEGAHILEVATYMDYGYFKRLQDADYREYAHRKQEIATRLLDLVEERHIPDLRRYVELKVVGTPTTHADFCNAPQGNAYGSYFTPSQMGIGRLTAQSPFPNFWWCNASSGSAGIHGTTATGIALYQRLTGDRFFDPHASPPMEHLARLAQLSAVAARCSRPM